MSNDQKEFAQDKLFQTSLICWPDSVAGIVHISQLSWP